MESEKPMDEDEIKRKMKADLFKFQLQTQSFDEKIDKLTNEKIKLEAENRKLNKEGKELEKIKKNNDKIAKIMAKIKNLINEKEKSLGCICNSQFTDDTNLRPTVNIK